MTIAQSSLATNKAGVEAGIDDGVEAGPPPPRAAGSGAGRVLIAGCGYVGRALGQALALAGHEVWGLSRKPQELPAALRGASADLADAATLAALPRQFAYVVYAASADAAADEAYRRAYVAGTTNLIQHLDREHVRRLFFVSSTAVYAQSDGGWVNEASTTEPRHFTGLRTLEAERVVAGAPFPTSILRCSGIYGPGRDRLVTSVRRQEAVSVSERYTNRIHRDDIVGSVMHLIERGNAPGLLLLSDDEPVPQRSIVEYLAERLGLPLPPLRTSTGPGARGGNKRCDNRLLKSLGYTLRYPSYREGYAELLNT